MTVANKLKELEQRTKWLEMVLRPGDFDKLFLLEMVCTKSQKRNDYTNVWCKLACEEMTPHCSFNIDRTEFYKYSRSNYEGQ